MTPLNQHLEQILATALTEAMQTAKPALDAALERERQDRIVAGLSRPEPAPVPNVAALESIPAAEVGRRAQAIAKQLYGPAPATSPALSWRESFDAFRNGATGFDRIAKLREFEAQFGTERFWSKPPFKFTPAKETDLRPALGTVTADPSQCAYSIIDGGQPILTVFQKVAAKPAMGTMTRSWSSGGRVKTMVFQNLDNGDLRALLVESDAGALNQQHHDAEVKRAQGIIGIRDHAEFEKALAPPVTQ